MKWFRFYSGAVHDPKVQRLPPELFKVWVNLLCLASENDGKLPSPPDLAFILRMPEAKIIDKVDLLMKMGLLDDTEDGVEPHNWNGRQFKSDDSAERVKRHRKRKDAVTVTPPEQSRTETDTEVSSSSAKSRIPSDFAPEQKLNARINSELGFSGQDLVDELASFKDYFHARAGPKALHSDWQITFWNWCKRSKRFNGQDGRSGRPKQHNSISKTFADMHAIVKRRFPSAEDEIGDRGSGEVIDVISGLRKIN